VDAFTIVSRVQIGAQKFIDFGLDRIFRDLQNEPASCTQARVFLKNITATAYYRDGIE
jgi:hypothetical protein